jgi:hypothetical protein
MNPPYRHLGHDAADQHHDHQLQDAESGARARASARANWADEKE